MAVKVVGEKVSWRDVWEPWVRMREEREVWGWRSQADR